MMMPNDRNAELEEKVLAQEWFYRYVLPSGRVTRQYVPEEINQIHETRRHMMLEALKEDLAGSRDLTAIDFSSHQGFFSLALAEHCKSVRGLEYQERHVSSARLIAEALRVRPGTHERRANRLRRMRTEAA